jgi:hypothetical protein
MVLAHVGEAHQQVDHPTVAGQHPRAETPDVARLGCGQQRVEHDGAKPPVLPSVLDDEGDLGSVVPVGRLVARHAHQLGRFGGALFGEEGETAVIVHVGEKMGPVGRQASHDAEEALVRGMAAQPIVERDQALLIFGADRAKAHPRAVAQEDCLLQIRGIRGRIRGGVGNHRRAHCSGSGPKRVRP